MPSCTRAARAGNCGDCRGGCPTPMAGSSTSMRESGKVRSRQGSIHRLRAGGRRRRSVARRRWSRLACACPEQNQAARVARTTAAAAFGLKGSGLPAAVLFLVWPPSWWRIGHTICWGSPGRPAAVCPPSAPACFRTHLDRAVHARRPLPHVPGNRGLDAEPPTGLTDSFPCLLAPGT